MTNERTVVAIAGDLHVNSTVAVCPPVVMLDDGGEYRASKPQRWLWREWVKFWGAVRRRRINGVWAMTDGYRPTEAR